MTTIIDQVHAPNSTFNTAGGDQYITYITNAESAQPAVSASSGPLPAFIEAPIDLLSIHFTGRQRELGLITQAFTRPRGNIPLRCALFGDQGVGKSQLTYKWAKSTFAEGENRYVIWMSATTIEKVDQGFSKILHVISHPDRFRPEQAVRLMAARRWLEEVDSGNWLLVLDNVFPDEVRFIQEHLPRKNSRGSILFATRTRNVAIALASVAGEQHDTVQVPMLDVQDGVELFCGHFRDGDMCVAADKAEGIVKSVGCLPLAISHAAAYLKESGMTPEEMLGSYKGKDKINMLGWQHSLTSYEHKSITATFENQLEDLESKHPQASNLLKMLAFFDPESIPIDVLVDSATKILKSQQASSPRPQIVVPSRPLSIIHRTLNKVLHRGNGKGKGPAEDNSVSPLLPQNVLSLLAIVQSPIELRNAITELQTRCLTAYQDSSQSTLRIHDLVQLVVLETMKTNGTDQQWLECAVELVCYAFEQMQDYASPACWPQCEALIPHIQSLTIRREISNKATMQLVVANSKFGSYLRIRGRYGEAEGLLVQVLTDEEQLLGSEDERTLATMHRLAVVYRRQGRFVDAETLLKRVLRTQEKVLGSEHVDALKTMHSLASVYESQRRYAESEELIKKVMKAREQRQGLDHIETLKTKNMLALLYHRQKHYDQAETLYKEVLQSMEKKLGPDSFESAMIMNNLALVYRRRRQYSAAEELFKRVLRIWEKQLGSDHPNTLIAKDNLALVYKSQGRYKDAEELFVHVLAHREEVLGRYHPHTRDTTDSLVSMYEDLGRFDDAAKVQRPC